MFDVEKTKEMFQSSAEILFGNFPNKEIILSQIREILVYARSTERHISDLAENVTIKQMIGLKWSHIFSIALDEIANLNDLSHLAIDAR